MARTAMEWMDGGSITTPEGFLAAGVACGIKASERKDLALIVSELPCVAAATFTTNKVKAAHIIVCRENLRPQKATVRAIVVNSGNANCCTGGQGVEDARRMCEMAAHELSTQRGLNIQPHEVLVASTGVIGVRLPMDKVEQGITMAVAHLSRQGGREAAEAIMTTDTKPKFAAVRLELFGKVIHIGGIAKGAGMIAPNMATMLCFIGTDACIGRKALQSALRYAVERSFNSITVDGDTSTNDTVVLMANWMAGGSEIAEGSDAFLRFREALTSLCQRLAKMIAADGEGATKLVEICVTGAESERDAKAVALTVANSLLVKTALFGNDPNWGRIAAAVGRAPARVKSETLTIRLGEFECFRRGEPVPFDEAAAHEWLKASREITLHIDLGIGAASWTVWTCDLSTEYVRFNAEYTT
ncbi:MAG: bifunctional glutamate N-acetyltransferase/amino-acid acetyltransferase ArgJ [Armatimonadota bacterium]|nr:bifunctional glutamate N-acetyltransferase/amino-acid acetyltransferase ArgJ [Armatimonadota bacterium]MDT7973276.1 bifunctional glutamate N-acetyltransferase/amino-acid acetyltransferase ArgJ [Armatimonadota bacterium]